MTKRFSRYPNIIYIFSNKKVGIISVTTILSDLKTNNYIYLIQNFSIPKINSYLPYISIVSFSSISIFASLILAFTSLILGFYSFSIMNSNNFMI